MCPPRCVVVDRVYGHGHGHELHGISWLHRVRRLVVKVKVRHFYGPPYIQGNMCSYPVASPLVLTLNTSSTVAVL